ncbi:MAG: tRNA pseudouridine(55) synthase TruB [Candidatus Sericytochromatia bacterium]|nr:tRNA pseudouridine(55) synthase TruB [Candidatus Sericytochromatia bacterium]
MMLARWLPIDKPAGYTSHDVVAVARKRLGLRKIGHTGTLDPDATGVLVLALGKATRLIQYLPGGKAYRAHIRLGLTTDTWDLSGQVLNTSPVPALTADQIREALVVFEGPQQQLPPMVSAVSYQGQRLYKLARQGIDVPERPLRQVEIEHIQLQTWQTPDLVLDVSCSAGTYIRSLAHDLGQRLGCGAALASLVRTRANGVPLEICLSLDSLEPLSAVPEPGLLAEALLAHIPVLSLTAEVAQQLVYGQSPLWEAADSELLRLHTPAGQFLGLGQIVQGQLRSRLIMDPALLE